MIIPTLPACSKKFPVPGTGEVGFDESPDGFAHRMPECCDSTILTLMSVFLSQNTQGSARAAEGGRAEPQAGAKALHDLTAECGLQDVCPVFGVGSGGSLSSPGREAHLGINSTLFHPVSASSPPLPSLSLSLAFLLFPVLCFPCLSFPPLFFPFLLKEL